MKSPMFSFRALCRSDAREADAPGASALLRLCDQARSMARLLCISLLGLSGFAVHAAEPALPLLSPIFGDHMVLQRGKPNTVWGWAAPGAEIRLTLDKHLARATAAADGRWSASVEVPAPGGPYELVVDGPGDQDRVLRDLLVGDVWLCGGQSNMDMGIALTRDVEAAIAAAERPGIRLFRVPSRAAYSPAEIPGGEWQRCTPDTIASGGWGGFSAVAYHFGRRLHEELGLPIGLVQSCSGVSPAEAWAGAATLRGLGDFDRKLDEIDRLRAAGAPAYGNFITHWLEEFDPGHKNNAWFAAELDERDWHPVALPKAFAALGVADTPALVYLRRTFVLLDPLPSGKARVRLGRIEHIDTVYVNGQRIGGSISAGGPCDYAIPDDVLRPGANTLVVRLLKTGSGGALPSPAGHPEFTLGDGTKIPVAEGEWRARLAVDARPPHPLPLGYEFWPVMPSVLYQGMIAPLQPLALTGAIWYQGESNIGRADQYRRLLPAIIADWRRGFGQGDFPFYIVSLAAVDPRRDQPGDDVWAEFREAQAWVARATPRSGLAVAIDKGEADDVHARDKREVGERLALQALAGHYGKKLAASGPVFRSAEPVADASALRLHFDHVDGGLIVAGRRRGAGGVLARGRGRALVLGRGAAGRRYRCRRQRLPFRAPFTCATPGRPTRGRRFTTPPACPPCPSAPTDPSPPFRRLFHFPYEPTNSLPPVDPRPRLRRVSAPSGGPGESCP